MNINRIACVACGTVLDDDYHCAPCAAERAAGFMVIRDWPAPPSDPDYEARMERIRAEWAAEGILRD